MPRSRRAFQVLLGVMSIVMVGAGLGTALFGADTVPREGVVTPDVDSEMRFYAVWYVISGLVLLRAISRVETSTFEVRVIAAGFFVAGCSRAISWVELGEPHTSQIILMFIELSLPFVIVPWQLMVSRSKLRPTTRSSREDF